MLLFCFCQVNNCTNHLFEKGILQLKLQMFFLLISEIKAPLGGFGLLLQKPLIFQNPQQYTGEILIISFLISDIGKDLRKGFFFILGNKLF